MTDPRTDAIASVAARLLDDAEGTSMRDAIDAAVAQLSFHDVMRPSSARVRKHAAAYSMQVLGEAGHRDFVRDVMRVAERLMTFLEETFDDMDCRLVGRGAKGLVDGGVTLHVRMYTRLPIATIAETLEGVGYDQAAIETALTRHGRLDRIRLVDDVEIVLTRCPPELRAVAAEDLFSGERIAIVDLATLREQVST